MSTDFTVWYLDITCLVNSSENTLQIGTLQIGSMCDACAPLLTLMDKYQKLATLHHAKQFFLI